MLGATMRRLAVIAAVLALAVPAAAQTARPPRVQVTVERGPLPVRTLERAWPGRAFRRCQDVAPAEVVHLHVRVDPDATVVVEHGLGTEAIDAGTRCVLEVLNAARLPVQTEPTHATVTVWFVPVMARDARQSFASRQPTRAAPSRAY